MKIKIYWGLGRNDLVDLEDSASEGCLSYQLPLLVTVVAIR